jgi:hypothetical protein
MTKINNDSKKTEFNIKQNDEFTKAKEIIIKKKKKKQTYENFMLSNIIQKKLIKSSIEDILNVV